jgi:lipopolysaccharide/colanic/teichoic acid biosynthesis glycosyltransferase
MRSATAGGIQAMTSRLWQDLITNNRESVFMVLGSRASRHHGIGATIASFWTQLAAVAIVAILAPMFLLYPDVGPGSSGFRPLIYSVAGSALATLLGLIFVRKVTAYPGVQTFGYALPTFAATYACVFTFFIASRIDYGRLYFGASLFLTVSIVYIFNLLLERYVVPKFFIVPFGEAEQLLSIDRVDWSVMASPSLPSPNGCAIVADLRYDFAPEWERMLAEAAVQGHPVYHFKQLGESLTGRVSISHMSENSLGSLLPNLGYRNFKRVIDVIGALILIPLLLPLLLSLSVIIMIDSCGGALFRQKRMGYRGREFEMIKFRTMKVRAAAQDNEAARHDAITQSDDARITRVGRFLRRSRLDELPQVFNVLAGQMSFIGPRPEAIALSKWYEENLPFYLYRHIVRPGITGWAQVNQGHVADLESVSQKLNYDFFYIKNFSLWLDALIVIKTIQTILTGFGSK